MIDVILIIIGSISVVATIIGFKSLNKTNSDFSEDEAKKIQLLREEKLISNKKSFKRKKSIAVNIKNINNIDQKLIYQTAREKRLPVGELLLAARINSLK